MKKLIPSWRELAVLVVVAVFCGVLLYRSSNPGGALFVLTFPVVLIGGLMGSYRTGKLAEPKQSEATVAAARDS